MHGVQPTAKAAPTRLAPTRVVGRRAIASRRSVCIRPRRQRDHRHAHDDQEEPRDQVQRVLVLRERVADQAGAGAVGREHEREARTKAMVGPRTSRVRAPSSSKDTPEMNDR